MTKQKSVLIIDDEPTVGQVLAQLLQEEYVVEVATSGLQGLKMAQKLEPDLILLDLKMPQMDGLEVLRRLAGTVPGSLVLIMTAYGRVESAVEAMKLGAVDYIMKPFEHAKLVWDIKKTLSLRERSERSLAWREKIVGQSPQMQKVWRLIEKFAPSDVTILLEGESGTGKELFARAIHEMSKREGGPFIVVDCATLPDTLIESELFGYEKGAFTGAMERKPGRFELADQGTLFLDEVGNLSPTHQMKLLRAIQQYEITPLGSKRVKQVDIRVVAATNIRLREVAAKGAFRSDLFYRLSAVTIDLPPLRERQGDIQLLADYFFRVFNHKFLRRVTGISPEVLHIFDGYAWPGNVRELENVMRSAVLLADEQILPEHLPPSLQAREEEGGPLAPYEKLVEVHLRCRVNFRQGVNLKEVSTAAAEAAERKLLTEVLQATRLNQSELAKFLGVDPKTLRTKLRQFDLTNQESEESEE